MRWLLVWGLAIGALACGDDAVSTSAGNSDGGTAGDGQDATGGSETGVGTTGGGGPSTGDGSAGTGTGDTTGDDTTGGTSSESTGTGGSGGTAGTGGEGAPARVRFMHLGVGLDAVDAFVDMATPPVFEAVGFREGTGYMEVGSGDRSLEVAPAGTGPMGASIAGALPLTEDRDHTAVVLGDARDGSLEVLTLVDESRDSTLFARLRFTHAAPAAGGLDLLALSPTDSPFRLFPEMPYGSSDITEVVPGMVSVGIDLGNDFQPDLTYDIDLSGVAPGTFLDVFITSDAEDPAGIALAVLFPDAVGTVRVIEANEAVGCRYYVDQARGSDVAHGRSWVHALKSLRTALLRLNPSLTPGAGACHVWVAEGTYLPSPSDLRSADFELWDGVEVYGGFGGDETLLEERDPAAHRTILSGDVGVPDDESDNSWHVVVTHGDTRLDGLEIRNGNSDGLTGEANRHGGGIRALGKTVIADCIVADNRTGDGRDEESGSAGGAGGCGGGLYAPSGLVRIERSRFENNTTGRGGYGSEGGGGGAGGAVCTENTQSLEIIDSVFIDNTTGGGGAATMIGGSGGQGGAVFIEFATGPIEIRGSRFEHNVTGSGWVGGGVMDGASGGSGALYYENLGEGSLRVVDSEFIDNEARFGAGIDITSAGSPGPILLMNVIIRGNQALTSGGGFRLELDGSAPFTIANSAIVDNDSVGSAGGIDYVPIDENGSESPSVFNSIVWGNTAPQHPQVRALPGSQVPRDMRFEHTDLQGGCPDDAHAVQCVDLLDVDPAFVDQTGGDLQLQGDSPLRNAGDQSLLPDDVFDLDDDLMTTGDPWPYDLLGAERVEGTDVDLGPYEVH